MKVFLDQFCLANGGDESPKGLTVQGEQAVQTVPLLRSASAGIVPRGNRVNTVTFTVTRLHPSYGAAEASLFQHAAMLPGGGALGFVCERQ